MVMQMNSHLEAGEDPKVDDIEDILDGNICRCTAYRPILDSFKSFAQVSVILPNVIKTLLICEQI